MMNFEALFQLTSFGPNYPAEQQVRLASNKGGEDEGKTIGRTQHEVYQIRICCSHIR